MFSVTLLATLCITEAAGHHGKPVYPPPVLDGGGYPGYHNCGGWGRPYGGYGWTGYYCPDYRHIRVHSTLPLEPLVVPPPGAFDPPSDDEDDTREEKKQNGRRTPKETDSPGATSTGSERAGLEVARLTPDLAEKFGFPKNTQGLFVLSVARTGPAARADLRKNEVITHIGNDPVESTAALDRAITEAALTKGIALQVQPAKGQAETVTLKK